MKYYPILITVYSRVNHLEKLINSLKENKEATETELYIGSDFPKKTEDVNGVDKVRQFLQNISGFKKVHLYFWKTNIGQKESIYRLKNEIKKTHDGFIFFEDDNIVSKHYLSFMNYNLNKWKDNERIACICGYFYPIDISFYSEYDIIFIKEYNAWGSGFWFSKDYYMDKMSKEYFDKKKEKLKEFKKISMNSYYILMDDLRSGRIYGDARMAFQIFIDNQYAVFPKYSLVRNIGQDGSGMHSGKNNELQFQELNTNFSPKIYPKNLVINIEIQKIISQYRSYTLVKRIKIRIINFLRKVKCIG